MVESGIVNGCVLGPLTPRPAVAFTAFIADLFVMTSAASLASAASNPRDEPSCVRNAALAALRERDPAAKAAAVRELYAAVL
ncbi:hypothetical protein BH160DRAFT_5028, partial [Burkholderia sp. H160]